MCERISHFLLGNGEAVGSNFSEELKQFKSTINGKRMCMWREPAWHVHANISSLDFHSREPCHEWRNGGCITSRSWKCPQSAFSIESDCEKQNSYHKNDLNIKQRHLQGFTSILLWYDKERHYHPALLLRIKISNSYYVEMLSWNRSVGRSLSEIFGGSPPYQ